MTARITNAQVRLQVDVGFGDAVTPEAQVVEFPPLLDFPAPKLRAYPKETVVAEKLEALVQLGLANTRMKDFYDLVALSNLFEFEGQVLVDAISATFARRGTTLPADTPAAFTAETRPAPGRRTRGRVYWIVQLVLVEHGARTVRRVVAAHRARATHASMRVPQAGRQPRAVRRA